MESSKIRDNVLTQQLKNDPRRINELLRIGRSLQAKQVADLEKSLRDNEDDLDARLVMLGYYDAQRFKSNETKEARIKHVAWFVEHHPDHPAAGLPVVSVLRGVDDLRSYVEIRSTWCSAIENNRTTTVLGNAAQFFMLEEIDKAERCLLTAQQLEPTNSRWASRLSHLYKLWGTGFERVALEQAEHALELIASGKSQLKELATLPALAFEADEMAKASRYATELLAVAEKDQNNFYYGTALEAAHATLGRIALQNGDRSSAAKHLEQSLSKGKIFSQPDRLLAAELFHSGEREAIKKWLDLSAQYQAVDNLKLQLENNQSPWTYLLPDGRKYFSLSSSPRTIYDSGRFELAEKHANEFIRLAETVGEEPMHKGFGLHTAHVVLGQLALRSTNKELAKEHLFQSTQVPEAQRLLEHGPDINLAADLMQTDSGSDVATFLKESEKLWGNRQDRIVLKVWTAEVQNGTMPSDWKELRAFPITSVR